jgi:glycosyltransferase involved in cell wall biosynthesis
MTSSDITVVIPTFNRSNLISRAIDSVLDQTVPAAEVIVVDDGSTDDTRSVVHRFGQRVRYEWQKNAGASASRNVGIRLATRPWIAFLDSDDYWTYQHLERMTVAIRETESRGIVYFSDMRLPAEDGVGTLWETIGFCPVPPLQLTPDGSSWALMKRQPMMLQSSVISKKALNEVGGLDLRLRVIHDAHLFCQLTIGQAACAVSGIGCIQTSDQSLAGRLTTAIPLGSSENATEHCHMWPDILANQKLPGEFRPLVRLHVANSRWNAAKDLVRARHYSRGIMSFARALLTDPGLAWWILRHQTREGYERTVRPQCAELIRESAAH